MIFCGAPLTGAGTLRKPPLTPAGDTTGVVSVRL